MQSHQKNSFKKRQQHVPLRESNFNDANSRHQQDYSDVLEDCTGCSTEYKQVLEIIEMLEIALKKLLKKATLTKNRHNDIVSSIMHKELINSIYSELQKLMGNLRKSRFAGQFLNAKEWKREFRKHIDKSIKSTSVEPNSYSSVYNSELNDNGRKSFTPSEHNRNVFKSVKQQKKYLGEAINDGHQFQKQFDTKSEQNHRIRREERETERSEGGGMRGRSKSAVG